MHQRRIETDGNKKNPKKTKKNQGMSESTYTRSHTLSRGSKRAQKFSPFSFFVRLTGSYRLSRLSASRTPLILGRYFLVIRWSYILRTKYQTLMCSYFKISNRSRNKRVFKNVTSLHIHDVQYVQYIYYIIYSLRKNNLPVNWLNQERRKL